MRPFNVKFWGCIGLLVGLAIILGCGSGTDLLDELGYRYQISVATPKDRNIDTNDIDVYQTCDELVSNGTEDEDPITAASLSLTFKSNLDQPDIWVYRLQLEFTLLERQGGNPAIEPSIPTNTYDIDIFVPGGGGTGTMVVDLMTITDKETYKDLIGQDDLGADTEAVFQVHVIAFLTYSPGNPSDDLQITKNFIISVGNFMDSSCSEEEEVVP